MRALACRNREKGLSESVQRNHESNPAAVQVRGPRFATNTSLPSGAGRNRFGQQNRYLYTTADVYTHTSAEDERKAALALERAIYGNLFRTVPETANKKQPCGD